MTTYCLCIDCQHYEGAIANRKPYGYSKSIQCDVYRITIPKWASTDMDEKHILQICKKFKPEKEGKENG